MGHCVTSRSLVLSLVFLRWALSSSAICDVSKRSHVWSIYHREARLNITEALEALAVRCAGSTVLRSATPYYCRILIHVLALRGGAWAGPWGGDMPNIVIVTCSSLETWRSSLPDLNSSISTPVFLYRSWAVGWLTTWCSDGSGGPHICADDSRSLC